ncbi:hypothetical protein SAMD00019534_093810 [Acytostelium subglobosum LB1]|uniref:hypothetical protein n=1 Tax=Acytostelium subglobosum LB1 TaxID=1410327 RepID=UPI000644F3CC|nr:hypothetical protein SAMD00019534_093810 [Acytostelium subglobosum LB1]GAM26206.1 hypothetical protein SAMD00019534_093810 [Acytostelium subglobosum LB1]|eukprot:XP_012750760.1 hypothetical protein SAMD00019534_093810 [Acytostelium subglobosum LB1]
MVDCDINGSTCDQISNSNNPTGSIFLDCSSNTRNFNEENINTIIIFVEVQKAQGIPDSQQAILEFPYLKSISIGNDMTMSVANQSANFLELIDNSANKLLRNISYSFTGTYSIPQFFPTSLTLQKFIISQCKLISSVPATLFKPSLVELRISAFYYSALELKFDSSLSFPNLVSLILQYPEDYSLIQTMNFSHDRYPLLKVIDITSYQGNNYIIDLPNLKSLALNTMMVDAIQSNVNIASAPQLESM